MLFQKFTPHFQTKSKKWSPLLSYSTQVHQEGNMLARAEMLP